MFLRLAYLNYMRKFCKVVLSQKSKYSIRYKNFNKSFKISLVLKDYIIDVKIKKLENEFKRSEECAYDGKIIMITICIVHLSLGLPLNEG